MEHQLYSTSGMARFAECSEATVRRAARAGIVIAQPNSSGARQFTHREAVKLREHIQQRRTAAA